MKRFLSLILAAALLLPACNKQAIEDLQSRLDRLEKTTLVTLNSQISSVQSALSSMQATEKQLGELIQSLQAKDASFADMVAALSAKDDRFAEDLAQLRTDVDANAADLRQWIDQAGSLLSDFQALDKQLKDIQDYISSAEGRLSGLEERAKQLNASLSDCQGQIQGIQESLKALQEDMKDVKDQIQALVDAVQSVVVVPDFSDGSVEIGNIPDNRIAFEVYPLNAAGLLAQLGASAVSLDAVETKAGSLNLPVTSTAFEDNCFIVTVDGSGLPMEVKKGDVSLSARLLVSDGTLTRSSAYFPLSVFVDPTHEDYTYVAESVDLGLSVNWSAYNLGADRPEGYGAIFAWGETAVKSAYDWSTYQWCKGEENTLTKYCTDAKYGQVDDKTVLDPEDDAAQVLLGNGWRMPTREEMAELLDSCSWAWVANYEKSGISGFQVTSRVEGFTDRSIFLPTAGFISHVGAQYAGHNGSYWSASLFNPVNPIFIYCIGFDFLGPNEGSGYRFHGRSIRPVQDKPEAESVSAGV